MIRAFGFSAFAVTRDVKVVGVIVDYDAHPARSLHSGRRPTCPWQKQAKNNRKGHSQKESNASIF
jgi:hypothetical protein